MSNLEFKQEKISPDALHSSSYNSSMSRNRFVKEEKYIKKEENYIPKYEEGQSSKKDDEEKPKEKPNFKPSGNLAADTNTVNGIVIKYNEPQEAMKPIKRWRLYVYRKEEELPYYQIHRKSAYFISQWRSLADIPVEHPSVSKQHAVIQFRCMDYRRKKDGKRSKRILPYLIDLDSTNGTYLNGEKIEPQRFYELRESDSIRFAYSSREFVLLHENSVKNNENVEVSSKDKKKTINRLDDFNLLNDSDEEKKRNISDDSEKKKKKKRRKNSFDEDDDLVCDEKSDNDDDEEDDIGKRNFEKDIPSHVLEMLNREKKLEERRKEIRSLKNENNR
ncbi:hypothetical protein SNEBB_005835 [Seison nebaliae]|nr:hypothetical protein SNEBB_005835 [Seison nebaliae]